MLTEIEKRFEKIRHSINEEGIQLILQFIKYYSTVEKPSKGSTEKYYYACKIFLIKIKRIGKTILSLDENTVLELMNILNNSSLSEETRADYWHRFCRFYAWVAHRREDEGKAPVIQFGHMKSRGISL